MMCAIIVVKGIADMVFDEFNEFKDAGNEDEFLTEYVVYYSKFLLTTYFNLIKTQIADLARRGHTRSLAKYLKNVKPEDWDEDLKQMGLAIKKQNGSKTAQEWEVVAAMQWHEPLVDCAYENMKDLKSLRHKICEAGKDFYYADEAYRDGVLSLEIYNQKKFETMQLTQIYSKQPYLQTLKKVQEGYYSAFVRDNNIIDAVGFLEATLDPDDFYLEEEKLKEYNGGHLYSKLDIAQTLINNFDSYKKNEDVPYDAFYAYGFALTLYGKSEKSRHKGIRALQVTSEFDVTKDQEIQIDSKREK